MGIWNALSEIVDAVAPWSVVEAEAPAEEPKVRLPVFASRGGCAIPGTPPPRGTGQASG